MEQNKMKDPIIHAPISKIVEAIIKQFEFMWDIVDKDLEAERLYKTLSTLPMVESSNFNFNDIEAWGSNSGETGIVIVSNMPEAGMVSVCLRHKLSGKTGYVPLNTSVNEFYSHPSERKVLQEYDKWLRELPRTLSGLKFISSKELIDRYLAEKGGEG